MQIRWRHLYAGKSAYFANRPDGSRQRSTLLFFSAPSKSRARLFREKVKRSFFGMLSILLRDVMEIDGIFRRINIKNQERREERQKLCEKFQKTKRSVTGC